MSTLMTIRFLEVPSGGRRGHMGREFAEDWRSAATRALPGSAPEFRRYRGHLSFGLGLVLIPGSCSLIPRIYHSGLWSA
jgi:hypothetical protein